MKLGVCAVKKNGVMSGLPSVARVEHKRAVARMPATATADASLLRFRAGFAA